MTITKFEKQYNGMTEIVRDIDSIGYTDEVISNFFDEVSELNGSNSVNDNTLYTAFVRCALKAAHDEVPSYSSINSTIRVTVSNRRCYYSKNGYSFSISTFIDKDKNLAYVLDVEINKDPEILESTRNTYYNNLVSLGFEVSSTEVGKKR